MARDKTAPAVLILRSGQHQLVRDWRAVGCEIEIIALDGACKRLPGSEVDIDAMLNETERLSRQRKTGRVPASVR